MNLIFSNQLWSENIALTFEKGLFKKLKVVENFCEVCFHNFFFSFSEGPTIVNVNLYVRSFEKIDDVKMVSFLSGLYWP